MKSTQKMKKRCLACDREWGPHMTRCCADGSLVAVQRVGLIRKRDQYFSLEGRVLDDADLAALSQAAKAAKADRGRERQQEEKKPLPEKREETRATEGGTDSTASGCIMSDSDKKHTETPAPTAGDDLPPLPPDHRFPAIALLCQWATGLCVAGAWLHYGHNAPVLNWVVGQGAQLATRVLVLFQSFLSDYGLSLVLLAALVPLALLPVTISSVRFAQKMARLKPLVENLQETHRDDKKERDKRIMELYRRHQSNPLGGCLLPLPGLLVFAALAQMAKEADVLRQASFLWGATWISNLAERDPMLLLPVLAAAFGGGVVLWDHTHAPSEPSGAVRKRIPVLALWLFVTLFPCSRLPAGLWLLALGFAVGGLAAHRIAFGYVRRSSLRKAASDSDPGHPPRGVTATSPTDEMATVEESAGSSSASDREESAHPAGLSVKRGIRWKHVVRDVIALQVLVGIAGGAIGFASASQRAPKEAVGLAGFVAAAAGFMMSGALARTNRLRHLLLVGLGVWLFEGLLVMGACLLGAWGIVSPPAEVSASRWLTVHPLTTAVHLVIGLGLSYMFVRAPRDARTEGQQELTGVAEYAGFWRRLAACLVDSIAVAIATVLGFACLATAIYFIEGRVGGLSERISNVLFDLSLLICVFILGPVLSWMYRAGMESCPTRATLGKMALGLLVTDRGGNRISFGRATGRHFAKYLSNLSLGIGYLMAAFTENRQAFHDVIAHCVLVMKAPAMGPTPMDQSAGPGLAPCLSCGGQLSTPFERCPRCGAAAHLTSEGQAVAGQGVKRTFVWLTAFVASVTTVGIIMVLAAPSNSESPGTARSEARPTTLGRLPPEQIDRAVLEEVAKVLETRPVALTPTAPFSEQPVAGDALDIVEATMAIEVRLSVDLDDEAMERACGATGVDDIAQKLTIAALQRFARQACDEKHRSEGSPKPKEEDPRAASAKEKRVPLTEEEIQRQLEKSFSHAYIVELYFEKRPEIDRGALLQSMRRYCGNVEILEPRGEDSLSLIHHDHPVLYPGRPAPVLFNLMSIGPVPESRDAGEAEPAFLTTSYQPSWGWRDAKAAVDTCSFSIMTSDLLAAGLHYKERLELYRNSLRALLEVVDCKAIHFTTSQQFVKPSEFLKSFAKPTRNVLYGAVNVRGFNIDRSEDVVMDTLGLAAIGLPDVQCHFRGLDRDAVAGMLYSAAHDIYENGDIIRDGQTMQGIMPRDRWKCLHEVSMVEPLRQVIDIRPGAPHAAGHRE